MPIRIADRENDDKHDFDRMIETRKWIMAKELPRKYGEIAAMPAPPPIFDSPPLAIDDAKTIKGKPSDDPLGEAFENFHRALQERNS